MLSLAWVTVVVSVISTAAEPSASPALHSELFGSESFKVLANLLEPAVQTHVLERLGHQADDEMVPLSCGYFCDSDAAEVHTALAKGLRLDPRQLGDMKLINTNKVIQSHHEPWAEVAIVFLDYPEDVAAPTWIDADGTKAALTRPDHWQGSTVVMSAAASVSFSSPVKLAIIPVLRHLRPARDYYVGSGIWQALVSAHRRSGFLGLSFFRGHSKYPLYWHACVWSGIGAALLTLLAMPFLYRPLNRLAHAIEKRLGRGKTEEVPRSALCPTGTSVPKGRNLPSLLGRRLPSTQGFQSATLPMGAFTGDNDHRMRKQAHGCPSPMTPGTQQLSFHL